MNKELLLSIILSSAQVQLSKTMNKPAGTQVKKKGPVYLDKKDSVFVFIRRHVLTDLQTCARRAAPNSPESKARAEEMKSWSDEKRNNYEQLFETSVRAYLEKPGLDFETFMLLFPDFAASDKNMFAAYDFRVREVGANTYAAEFWEDGMEANSEANALVWAHKILEHHPGDSTGTINEVKETYARARKAITTGKVQRYTKVMAVLYTKQSTGILFKDPFQALIDFK
jgi:hypothetical protein